MKKEAGHTFLAKLGKKRLRPGGKIATDWLIKKGHFTKDKYVLEVGCNMCTTAMQIAKTYGCRIEGVDLNAKALEKGIKNALKKENRSMFFNMFKTMKRYKKDMNYIVHAVRK